MPHPRFTNEEIGQRGEELYQQKIRSQVEPGNKGKYLAIDIETGDYEIGDHYSDIAHRLHAKHPGAAVYVMRIGFPAAARIGGRFMVADP
jgi:hypothetical protein